MKWLLRDRYDTVSHLTSFSRPVLVVIAQRDSVVPARFGEALYDALADPKQLRVVKSAEHNDWTDLVDVGWWQESIGFLLAPSH